MKKFLLLFSAMLFIVGFTFSQNATLNTVSEKTGYKVGDTAEDFKLKNINDEWVSLEGIEDVKGYIVTFTCNTCPVSVAYEDRIIELHNKFAPRGYPVVAIMPNDPELKPGDSFESMKVRAKEKNFPFAYLFDEGQKVYPVFGASRTPHVFILSEDLIVEYIGAIDDNKDDPSAVQHKYVEDAIATLEKGGKPDPNFTRAVGCSIKDKNAMNKQNRIKRGEQPEKRRVKKGTE